jgi:hypothetical protein
MCKTTVSVATDLLRIFPCDPTKDEVKEASSKKQLQEQINKCNGQILEMRNLLETSFLKLRESEKWTSQLK